MTTPGLEPARACESELPAWLRPWIRFWFAPIDPTGLGFMRLCCGLLVFYTTLVYSYDLYSYIGPNSWLDATAQEYLRKQVPVPRPPDAWTSGSGEVFAERGQFLWSIYFHVHDPFWVVVIHVGILAVMLLFAVGLWTRVTSVLAWIGAIQYVHRVPTHLFGMDTMLMILLLYLMIGNSGAALSVDRWLERRRRARPPGRRGAEAILVGEFRASAVADSLLHHLPHVRFVEAARLVVVERYGPVVVPGQLQLRSDARGDL